MKINKFKSLSVAICCLVVALWTETQGMEQIRNDEQPVINHQVTLPAGIICSFAAETPPDGWLLCHGQQCSSREYPELYKAIKTKFVPSDEEIRILRNNADEDNIYKLFYVPDLRGRVIVGIDGGTGRVTANNTLGTSSGEERHQLTESELAKHTHSIPSRSGSGNGVDANIGVSHPSSSIFTDLSGGDQPHNNMQPYLVLNYIINTGGLGKQAESNIQIEKINQLEKQIEEIKDSQRGCAKAWVVYKGGQTVSSYNCTLSRTHYGTFTVNFTVPFSSNNYSVGGSVGLSTSHTLGKLLTISPSNYLANSINSAGQKTRNFF